MTTTTARREAFDLAITACQQRANVRGIAPAEAAVELMQAHPDNLAAFAAAHSYLYSQESKKP